MSVNVFDKTPGLGFACKCNRCDRLSYTHRTARCHRPINQTGYGAIGPAGEEGVEVLPTGAERVPFGVVSGEVAEGEGGAVGGRAEVLQ